MIAPRFARLRAVLLGTKAGRMGLLAFFLALLAWAIPAGCSRRWRGTGPTAASPSPIGDLKAEGDPAASPNGFAATLTLGQRYDALIRGWGHELSTTKADLDATRRELQGIRKELAEERSAGRKEKESLNDILRRLEDGLRREHGGGANPTPSPREKDRPLQAHEPGASLRALAFSPGKAAAKAAPRFAHIPAATGGEATLLNGVFAPVAGEPSPVRLRFDAALVGPNRSRIGLRDAYLIGKAQGDANSSRVIVQIDRLSYVAPDGRTVEAKALGYVVGADGLEGVPGSYEWRATELLPLAIGGGAVTAGSEALAMGETNRSLTPLGGAIDTVSGNPLKYAGFRSLAGGSNKLTEILAERMREIRPAVSAKPGQEVTVVFLEGVTLEEVSAQEMQDGMERDPFDGLDLHR